MTDLERKLSFSRTKPRSIVTSLSYRFVNIGRKIIGKERLLRFFLNGSRLFWRFAFELSGELYGGKFHCRAKALSGDFLKRWIPENGSVIYIGCGVGRWYQIASKYAKNVVGIDYDADLIKIARELHDVASVLLVEVPDFEHDSLNWIRLQNNCPFYSDGDHIREYTLEILTNQFERNGWKVLESFKNGGAVLVVCK